jgi:PAS domain S-box-containing protein
MQNLLKRLRPAGKKSNTETPAVKAKHVNSMVVAAAFVAIIYVGLDTFLHIFFADRFNLLALMFGKGMYDIYSRVIVLCLFVILGSHAQYTINNLKQKEDELEEYRHHLEELVKDRTNELEEANAKLRAEVAERKRSEAALRESEEKYRLLVENANDAIFIIQDGRVTFPNPKAAALSREMSIDIDRTPFFDYIHAEDKDNVLQWYKRRLKNEDVPQTCSFKLVNPDNNQMWVELNAVLIHWEKKIAALNFLRDITAQKKLERQFQQSQRMESIGTLAGGIAHDFNNLLMGIQGNASVMLLEVKPEEPLYEQVKSIERCVKSGAHLTKQLLGFARGGKYVVKPTYLNDVLSRTAEIFGRTRREINIHNRYRKKISMVNVDVGQIEQVLLNLYVNAWQAMPNGGDLYLETDNVVLDDAYARRKPYALKPGNYVKISVTDNGTGMDKATQQRIFEPFFSTKDVGKGTGLGLASAYGIVKNHGGIINCYSELGRGSTFNIYLPAMEAEPAEEELPAEESVQGSGTVLLVDDEAVIVDVGRRMIESLGYEVLPARNGEEALRIFKNHHGRIDLVILDMVMPYLNGGEVFDQMKSIDPAVRVLLASGYSLNGQAETILARGCNGFIQKPFNTVELSHKIREIIDTAN